MNEEDELYLLDGHSIAHRAFYALPMLTDSDGEYTNSVFGFTKILLSLIDDRSPEYLAVAFDREGKTFRHEEFEDYKADRKETPDELKPQFDKIKRVLNALNVPIFEKEGFEADDLIGTLAHKANQEDINVVIVTGDRDALQLVNEKTKVLYTRRGIKDRVMYDLDRVREEYELEPDQLVDMKGLMGDSSDNIPGVPGIGEKTATKLLKEFSDLETILDSIEEVSGKKRKENLRKYSEQARMSKRLGLIDVDVPLEFDLDDCHWGEFEEGRAYECFADLEFNSLLDRFESERKKLTADEINLKDGSEVEWYEEVRSACDQQNQMDIAVIYPDEESPLEASGKILVKGSENNVFKLSETDIENISEILQNEDISIRAVNGKEFLLMARKAELDLPSVDFEPALARYLLNPSDNLPSHEEIILESLEVELEEDVDDFTLFSLLLLNLDSIEDELTERLKEDKLYDLYEELELPLLAPLACMEFNGIKLDYEYLNELSERWQKKIDSIVEEAHELAGEEFNLNSPQQVGDILFEKLGLPVIKKTKTGYSTSMSVLEELEDKHDIVPLIMEYRHWSKLKSTYLDALPPLVNEKTGRLHTSFNQMVTATGRLSSTDPNLQNIPIRSEEGREIRRAFVPRNENWKLLAADYSQIELRILAHISEDKSLMKTFREQGDIHNETARRIFEVEGDQVTGNMRRKAKVINFGIAYGMSAYSLSQDLDISRAEAEDFIERYFDRFSGVKEYMDDIVEETREKGYVTTILNRRRYIPEINSSNYHRRSFAERTAINTPIQGSAADIMKIAMLDVHEFLQDKEARLLLQVHDELVLEVPEKSLIEISSEIKRLMEDCYELNVPMTVDLEAGDNWKDKEEIEVN